MLQKTIIISILLILVINVNSQEERRRISITGKGGTNLFYGDVENYTYYKSFQNNNEWSLGYGLDLQMRLNRFMYLRGTINGGKLSGTKRKRNIWFSANLLESSLGLSFDILDIFQAKHRRFNPYVGAGLGILQYNSTLKTYPGDIKLASKGYTNGNGINGMTFEGEVPMFMGVNIFLTKNFDFQVESKFHVINSDELDAKKGGFEYDIYGFYSLGVTYHFTKKDKSSILPVQDDYIAKDEIKEEIPEVKEEIPEVEKEEIQNKIGLEDTKPANETEIVENTQPTKQEIFEEEIIKKERDVYLGKPSFENVKFYVQIAASKNPIERGIIAKSIGYPRESISVLKNNGWYKYVVGNYNQYWEAKNQRNVLLTKYDVQGAFVVATKDDAYIGLGKLMAASPDNNYEISQHKEEGITYSVQILASSNSNLSASGIMATYGIDDKIYMEESGGLKRYTVGSVRELSDAIALLRKTVDSGVSDAFMVAYKNGVRVPMSSVR